MNLTNTATQQRNEPVTNISEVDPEHFVIHVWLAAGEDPEYWGDRIVALRRYRTHWWQFWRRPGAFWMALYSEPVTDPYGDLLHRAEPDAYP